MVGRSVTTDRKRAAEHSAPKGQKDRGTGGSFYYTGPMLPGYVAPLFDRCEAIRAHSERVARDSSSLKPPYARRTS